MAQFKILGKPLSVTRCRLRRRTQLIHASAASCQLPTNPDIFSPMIPIPITKGKCGRELLPEADIHADCTYVDCFTLLACAGGAGDRPGLHHRARPLRRPESRGGRPGCE